MWKTLQSINKHLTMAIPAAMIAGFVFGLSTNASFLKPWIMPLTFLMVYPMMVNLKLERVLSGVDLRTQGLAQLINFAVMPFLAFGLGLVFFREQPYLALGLFLVGMIPTSGMTISWTGFAKGNKEAAIKMTVIGLLLGALLAPVYAEWLFGAALAVDFWAISLRIVLIVLLPMVAGYITRKAVVKKYGQQEYMKTWSTRFPSLATLGVLAIVFTAMALKAQVIYKQPGLLVQILIPLVLFYVVAYLLAFIVGRSSLDRGEGIALIYGTVMRNLAIALALSMNAFGEAGSGAALVVAIAFIVQVQSAAWSIRYVNRLFDKKPASEILEPA